jgi:hypothetical protein
VGAGTDVFVLGLAEGRGGLPLGGKAFVVLAVARATAALAGALLAGTAYLVVAAIALLPFPGFGDPGPSALGPASPGLLPVVLLLAGIRLSSRERTPPSAVTVG